MTDPTIEALLSAFREAELALPLYDGDPPDAETAAAFTKALHDLGYQIIPAEAVGSVEHDQDHAWIMGQRTCIYPGCEVEYDGRFDDE